MGYASFNNINNGAESKRIEIAAQGGIMAHKLYFAYGSNLNTTDWQRWCREKGLPSNLLSPAGIGFLPDQELVFDYYSSSRRGGALDLKPRAGQLVEGVFFEVEDGGWEVLDRKEGAPNCYEQFDTVALTSDGAELPVTTYRVCENKRAGFVVPTDEYVALVRKGLEEHNLDHAMLDMVSRNETPPLAVHAIFVYGTLMRGECRFSVLAKHGLKCILLAETPGRLLDLGSFPGMLAPNAADQWVQGEFVRLRDIGSALKQLDAIEGFRGFGQPDSLYRRALFDVGVGDGRIRPAWTYLINDHHCGAPAISSGSWRQHQERDEDFIKRLVAAYCAENESQLACVIANRGAFVPMDSLGEVTERLLPLTDAVRARMVSERQLAQATQKWVVTPS